MLSYATPAEEGVVEVDRYRYREEQQERLEPNRIWTGTAGGAGGAAAAGAHAAAGTESSDTSGGGGGGGGGGGFSTGNTETQGGYGASQPLFMGGTGGLTNGGGVSIWEEVQGHQPLFHLTCRERAVAAADHPSRARVLSLTLVATVATTAVLEVGVELAIQLQPLDQVQAAMVLLAS